ncbi:MAG: 16S rRNA (guanine(527)-N(7))-methyltransferase RsmG [Sphingorhabdus sp.]
MTDEKARTWLTESLNVSRETMERLDQFEAFLREEAKLQNLISASTLDNIWMRHIFDSAQLLALLPKSRLSGKWLDLGSGAGFPGLVAAIITHSPVTLVESRARRIDYLERAVELLDLQENVTVAGKRLERLEAAPFAVISARAFAPLPQLLRLAARFSTDNTCWLLPKGRNAARELAEVQKQREWRGRLDFKIEASLTDADAGILTGRLLGQKLAKKRKKA